MFVIKEHSSLTSYAPYPAINLKIQLNLEIVKTTPLMKVYEPSLGLLRVAVHVCE